MALIKAFGQNAFIEPVNKVGSMTLGKVITCGYSEPAAGEMVLYLEHEATELDFYGRKIHCLWLAKIRGIWYEDSNKPNDYQNY